MTKPYGMYWAEPISTWERRQKPSSVVLCHFFWHILFINIQTASNILYIKNSVMVSLYYFLVKALLVLPIIYIHTKKEPIATTTYQSSHLPLWKYIKIKQLKWMKKLTFSNKLKVIENKVVFFRLYSYCNNINSFQKYTFHILNKIPGNSEQSCMLYGKLQYYIIA